MRKKVFISSTCYDLIDLRAELESSIIEMGLNPILSDSKTSDFEVLATKHSIESCLHNVRNSHIYIIILSERYGRSLSQVGFGDISATELEYQTAKENNLPIYMYVRDQVDIDYTIYKKTNKIDATRFVQKDQALKLFELYEKHKALSSKKKESNWVNIFTNTRDLKDLLRRDLKADSGLAILTRMVEVGKAPSVAVFQSSANKHSQNNKITFSIDFINYGETSALNPYCFFHIIPEKNMPDAENLFDLEIPPLLHLSVSAASLLPGNSGFAKKEIALTDEFQGAKSLYLLVEIRYTTLTGHLIADASMVRFDWEIEISNRPNQNVIGMMTKHFSKKYVAGNNIKLNAEK